MKIETEYVNCPCCNKSESSFWAKENGFVAVKCLKCGFIYVNPRPVHSLINEAVQTGLHKNVENDRTAIAHRVKHKVSLYKKIIGEIYSDVWDKHEIISWLDIGAGYGEFIEAISMLAAPGSKIEGIEPMKPKVQNAIKRGINIKEGYLNEINEQFEYISLVDVFSHIPNFHNFLIELKRVLVPNGELFIETGNIGDLNNFKQVPTELDLPDHLVFAGELNIVDFLHKAGFEIIKIRKRRKDGFINLAKNILKKLLGRNVTITLPYTSQYRSLLIRAKLKTL
jgi:2-polyprenyl-3-methyl-5-hydroxy-6-metoxy-1,4-benzoquinol methylase